MSGPGIDEPGPRGPGTEDPGTEEPSSEGSVVDGAGAGGATGPRCAVVSREHGEPVEATAPHAVSWVAVVVPGAWPSDATSRAPEPLRAALAGVAGVRLVLVRPVGRAATDVGLLLAGTVPGRTWLREVAAADVDDAVRALAVDGSEATDALVTGRDPGLGRRRDRPVVLVCTNGARDACCAREGRPAAALLQTRLAAPRARLLGRARPRAEVWEASHLGGHRFAPTAAVLPHGMLLGGLGPDPDVLADAVDGVLSGRTVLDGYRGRSTYPPAEQAAETAVRRHLAVLGVNAGVDDVVVDGSEPLGPDGGRRVFARHSGGRTFRVVVSPTGTDLLRPASCGAAPTPVTVWDTEVDADTAPGLYLSG